MRGRIKVIGAKPVRVNQVETKSVKTNDLCQQWFEKLSKYYSSIQHFQNYSRDFLNLPWEQKKETILQFLQKYGFKNVIFENGEMSFEYAGTKVSTCSKHDIDALFGGLESAFVRLEPELL